MSAIPKPSARPVPPHGVVESRSAGRNAPETRWRRPIGGHEPPNRCEISRATLPWLRIAVPPPRACPRAFSPATAARTGPGYRHPDEPTPEGSLRRTGHVAIAVAARPPVVDLVRRRRQRRDESERQRLGQIGDVDQGQTRPGLPSVRARCRARLPGSSSASRGHPDRRPRVRARRARSRTGRQVPPRPPACWRRRATVQARAPPVTTGAGISPAGRVLQGGRYRRG